MTIYNLISFLGIFILMGLAAIFSADRRNMNWRAIGWGVGLQLIFALIIFEVPYASKVLLVISDFVTKILEPASRGAQFVFGRLAIGPPSKESIGFILAFQAFPTIIFFSALMSILYFFNIMPLLIRGFAYVFTKLMRISGAESLCTATNIFVGIESALTVKPHMDEMTRSELCLVLTAGMATVASSVLGTYIMVLRTEFPRIAAHLISASILSAPAAVVMAKIIVPESEIPKTLGVSVRPHYEKENNIFEAVINGANAGLKLIAGIIALLIAVLGLVALVDLGLASIGGWINQQIGAAIDWSLTGLLGYVFYPLTVIMGVPPSDAGAISRIIGQRAIETEFASYQALAVLLRNGALAYPQRSSLIASYALCGFAHLASMGIFVGGTAALAPGKIRALSQLGFRALLAATLACLMTACVAGTFFSEGSILFGN